MILKCWFIVVLTFAVACACRATLVTFSFTGATGNETSFAPDSQPAGGSVSDMSRGSGLLASASAGEFSARNWTTGTTRDLNDYYTFTITPNSGNTMTLTRLELDETRSGTGIRHWAICSSLDSGTALATFDVPDDVNQRVNEGVDLGASFNGLSSAVTFYIYGYEAEMGTGTWHIDNVELSGSLTAVPEPAASGAIAGVWLLALCGWRVWRQRRCGEKLKS